MKALLYKDFCQSRILAAMLIAAPVFFLLEPFFHWTFMAFWVLLVGCMVPLTVAFFDERDRWNELLPMLPYSPGEVVFSRYLFGWLETALVGLVLLIDLFGFSGQFYEDLSAALYTMALALVFQAVLFLALANGGGNSVVNTGIALILMAAVVLGLLLPHLQNLDRPLVGVTILAGAAILNLATIPLSIKRYASAFAPKERTPV